MLYSVIIGPDLQKPSVAICSVFSEWKKRAEHDGKLFSVVGLEEQAEIGRHLEKMAVFMNFGL